MEEKTKGAIAYVLALNTEVLVLDEPMNGLDPRTQRWLVEFLTSLNKAGKTLDTSTHNLELVQEISSRAILFDENHTNATDMPTEKLLEDVGKLTLYIIFVTKILKINGYYFLINQLFLSIFIKLNFI